MSQPITNAISSGAWKNQKCFIIGGSPDLAKFDFSTLNGECTIGINKSFLYHHSEILYCMDPKFYRLVHKDPDLKEQWKSYRGIKVFLKSGKKQTFDSSTYHVSHIREKCICPDLCKGIHPGTNSGFGALMIALALGANPIGLLGFSMRVDKKNSRTHFHDGYKGQKLKSMQKKLDGFAKSFEEFVPYFNLLPEVEIYNLCEDSKLTCFPKMRVEEFIRIDPIYPLGAKGIDTATPPKF